MSTDLQTLNNAQQTPPQTVENIDTVAPMESDTNLKAKDDELEGKEKTEEINEKCMSSTDSVKEKKPSKEKKQSDLRKWFQNKSSSKKNSDCDVENGEKKVKSVESDDNTEPYDTYDVYFANDVDIDSGSEREIAALRSDNIGNMGNILKKAKKNGNGAKHINSSSDDSDNEWIQPKRSKERNIKKKKPYSLTKRWSERDTEEYRNGYPGKRDHPDLNVNLEFYTNKMPSRPDGDYIDNIHKDWHGNYQRLEIHHGYIQWLFPIRESGMNYHAQELQLHESKAICENRQAHKRVLKSYRMMLDFYGMRLVDERTGELQRADNWRERFAHLNRSMHNYLRITRILKSLGELDYEHLKAPFVRFVLEEAIHKKTLSRTRESCINYWIETIKDDKAREELQEFAEDIS